MIKEDLFNIHRLCWKYGKANLADWAAHSLEFYCLNHQNFYSRLESLDWWNKIGSLCDLHLYAPDGSISPDESMKDNESLRRSLTVICEEMARAGFEHPQIKQTIGQWGLTIRSPKR